MQFDWMIQCYAGAGEFRDTPLLEELDRETVMRGVDAAIEAGVEGLWAPDHFMLGPKHQEYEVWTLLSALAERTDAVDLGPLVGSITYRNPALLAKMATTVDHLSDGRVRLGLGAGWHAEEHAAYDFEFPDIGTRIEMLEEGIEIAKAMFSQDSPRYEGRHFSIENAYNEPKPIQDPRPPIVVGGGGPQMLRVIARHADEWNVEISARNRGPPIEFKVEAFERYAREAGRDPDEIEKSWLAHVLVRENQRELDELCDEIFPLPWGEEDDIDEHLSNRADAREKGQFLIGTPEEILDEIESIRGLGFEKLQLLFLDFPDTRGMEIFGDRILQEFR